MVRISSYRKEHAESISYLCKEFSLSEDEAFKLLSQFSFDKEKTVNHLLHSNSGRNINKTTELITDVIHLYKNGILVNGKHFYSYSEYPQLKDDLQSGTIDPKFLGRKGQNGESVEVKIDSSNKDKEYK